MKKHARDNRPHIRPVTRIELSEKNIKLRWILIVVFLSIAVVSVTMGLVSALNTEPGWQEVTVSTTNINCSQDFVLMYEFGAEGLSATAEFKNVSSLYSQLTETGYTIFSAETESDVHNVWYLNRHVNEPVTVPRALYQALTLLAEADCRYPFLAPAVSMYDSLFLARSDAEAALYDPNLEQDSVEIMGQIAAFAADPAMISLELLGNDQVCLRISEEYLAYGEETGIETYLDFGWMKNAFLADYLADALQAEGYTRGYLASYDGFTRNLDDRDEVFSFNVFDRWENTITIPARLQYSGAVSIVSLRNYPLSEEDRWHYYAYESGVIRSVYLDVTDAVSRSSTDNLVLYGRTESCAALLLEAAPLFIAEELDEAALSALARRDIHSIWGEGHTLRCTDPAALLELLPDSGGADYRLVQPEKEA